MKVAGWAVAELIPQSLKKRLNWLQNTLLALTPFYTDRPGLEPLPSNSFSNILPSTFRHTGTTATSPTGTQTPQISSRGTAAQEKPCFPVDAHL